MKQIKLSQGKVTLVDDEDFDFFNQWKWDSQKSRNTYFAKRYARIKEKFSERTILMHRVIMKTPQGMVVDHIDGNGLNNQRSNLRNCSNTENLRNQRINKNNTSGAKGVSRNRNKWMASIRINGKQKNLGRYTDKKDAVIAYNEAAKKHYGEFALLNVIS